MHTTTGSHVDRVAGRIIKVIDRDCADRPVAKARGVATECCPRVATVGGLVNADARFRIPGCSVFPGTGLEHVVRCVIC